MKKYIKRFTTLLVIFAFIYSWIMTGNPFEWITFIIINPIANLLFIIYNLIGDFGSAVIIFTILVKLCMYPMTKRQLHQTRLMKKLQPELAEIRKRCAGNKQLESLETMDLYKKNNVRPLASMLSLFIQLPIFIAIYTAIRVIATPTVQDNLENRAYSVVSYEGSLASEVISLQKSYLENPSENVYDFHPYLFSVIPLDGAANNVMRGDFTLATLFALLCCIAAAFMQYIVTRQQQPTKKGKGFRALMQDAKEGKDIDQEELTAMSTAQMNYMMPLMMFLLMFNLRGALVFYYFLSNVVSMIMNKIILHRAERTMDDMVDKTMTRQLKKIKEAEIIENKKTGTKIKVKASSNKKRS